MAARAVFLDRDGVLTRAVVRDGKPFAPLLARDMYLTPDAVEAISSLRQAGFLTIVVTNQPDVARGTIPLAEAKAMQEHLQCLLPLDGYFACYHDDADGCDCKKPRPGMLLEAARRFDIDLAKSFMIGDRWKDIAAGKAAGCQAIFIDRGYDEPAPKDADYTVASLAAAAGVVLGQS